MACYFSYRLHEQFDPIDDVAIVGGTWLDLMIKYRGNNPIGWSQYDEQSTQAQNDNTHWEICHKGKDIDGEIAAGYHSTLEYHDVDWYQEGDAGDIENKCRP